jgi:hypothetical protein
LRFEWHSNFFHAAFIRHLCGMKRFKIWSRRNFQAMQSSQKGMVKKVILSAGSRNESKFLKFD